MKVLTLLTILTLGASGPLVAQQIAYGDTIVEVVGLRTWTVPQLEAAVQRYAPALTLASAACAVILRDSVGFADAAVRTMRSMGGDTVWTVLSVVEPSDSALVRYSHATRSRIVAPPEWEVLLAKLAADPQAVSALQHPEFLLDGEEEVYGMPIPQAAIELRQLLLSHNTEADWALASRIMAESSDVQARQAAALVLSNFPARDSTWYLLVEGMRVAPDAGASIAQMVFSGLARTERFRVDWRPALPTLEVLLGGTNLFAYGPVLVGLLETGIEPSMARRLAKVNPELLVDHALARNRMLREGALRFLLHSGAPNFGTNRQAWLDWIRGGVTTGPSPDNNPVAAAPPAAAGPSVSPPRHHLCGCQKPLEPWAPLQVPLTFGMLSPEGPARGFLWPRGRGTVIRTT